MVKAMQKSPRPSKIVGRRRCTAVTLALIQPPPQNSISVFPLSEINDPGRYISARQSPDRTPPELPVLAPPGVGSRWNVFDQDLAEQLMHQEVLPASISVQFLAGSPRGRWHLPGASTETRTH